MSANSSVVQKEIVREWALRMRNLAVDSSAFADLLERWYKTLEAATDPGQPPVYAQRDPRWRDEKLGFGNTTIGRYGCLVTCIAMMMTAEIGNVVTPADANEALKAANAFTGSNRNLVVWSRVPFAFPQVEMTLLRYCRTTPAPIEAINAIIDSGGYCLAKVDFTPGGTIQQHWCLIAGRKGDVYDLYDPWHGVKTTMPPAYCTGENFTAARWIFGVALYRGVA